jgi:anti-sigma factor RsiW
LLTCKTFVSELTDYLDDSIDAELKVRLEEHMAACPECYVVFDTTRKTVQILRGHERACCIPPDVHGRLVEAMERKMAARAGQTKLV